MDYFTQFTDDHEPELSLAIPEPKAGGDIRPNPRPLAKSDWPTDSAAETTAAREMSDNRFDDDVVIKSVDFHGTSSEVEAQTNNPGDIAEARRKVPAAATRSTHEARCYAFMGASGGAGVTTLCIQFAHDIAKRTKKSSVFSGHVDPIVCLIDLDFETGSCASFLDVQPSLSISDICGPADKIDVSSVQALMSHHESGIAVLSTPNALGANSLANPETVLALLDAASQLYEHVIIDIPRMWQSWIGAAISGADHFAIVGELTIPSLQTARARIADIEKVLGEDVSCEVVLNKVERRSFRNSVRLSDAEKALRRSVSATICIDHDTTREAINCGEAVEVIRPEARYVKDVRDLSLKWLPAQRKKGGIFKDRRKKRSAA